MLLVKRKGSCDGVTWRCPRKGCRKELLYEGEHFLKVSSIVQHFVVTVDFFLKGVIFLC